MATTTENGTTDITRQTRYQADPVTGQVKDPRRHQRQPSATGTTTDPGTRVTTYYTAGAHNPAACVSSVWYGQVCKTAAGAQPTTAPACPAWSPPPTPTTRPCDPPSSPRPSPPPVAAPPPAPPPRPTRTPAPHPEVDTTAIGGGVGTTVPTSTYGYDTSTGIC